MYFTDFSLLTGSFIFVSCWNLYFSWSQNQLPITQCQTVLCVYYRPGKWGHTHDDAGLQHGESSLVEVAEEPKPAAAGGRAHRVVRVHQELPQSQSPADMWVLLKLGFMIRESVRVWACSIKLIIRREALRRLKDREEKFGVREEVELWKWEFWWIGSGLQGWKGGNSISDEESDSAWKLIYRGVV